MIGKHYAAFLTIMKVNNFAHVVTFIVNLQRKLILFFEVFRALHHLSVLILVCVSTFGTSILPFGSLVSFLFEKTFF